jgi:hypothetical protein
MKLFKKLSIVVALAAVIPAYADEYKDTLNILREKNIITQKEYDVKLKAYEEREENKKFAEQTMAQLQKMDLDSNLKTATTLPNLQVEYTWTIDTTHQIMVSVKPQIRIKT